jgi:signal transduction histidine kinase/ligand-binding sensor domain-containing protein
MTMLRWRALVRRSAQLFGAALLMICTLHAARADEPTDFRRRLWTTEAGTPADIWAMAQGNDGYLWLGTGNGLYRFDGVRFERFEPQAGERFHSSNITALSRLADGSLWIGFYYGGASVLRHNHLQHFVPDKDFPGGMVFAFAQADSGLWAATEGGLAHFDGTRWSRVSEDWGYPSQRADWLICDREGTLWVTTGDSIMYLPRGARRFRATTLRVGKYAVMAQAPDGTLWLTDHTHGTRALPGLSASHPTVTARATPSDSDDGWSSRLLFDRYGNLWGSRVDKGGIYRVANVERLADGHSLGPQDITDTIDRAHGLVSDRAGPLLEDAEGTIWAGTNMGLASFHRNSFQVPERIPIGSGANYAMAIDEDGAAWFANDGTLYRADGEDVSVVRQDLNDVLAMQFNRADELWMIGRNRLYWLHGTALNEAELPVSADLTHVNALAFGADDQPWIAIAEHGLYRLQGGRWQSVNADAELPRQTPTALANDQHGHMWIGYADNRLVKLDDHGTTLYTVADGLRVGNLTVIQANGSDVLIGGEQGLARWHDGAIHSLEVAGNDAFSGISGIQATPQGDLWLNTGKGVVRIGAAEADEGFAQEDRAPPYRLFDYRDGLPGIAVQAAILPTAQADGEGRLWFLTNQGPAWIDPAKVASHPLAPPVIVQGVIADGKRYAKDASVHLPKGTASMQVQYMAATLAVPDRVRFRYRLDGVDKDWQDAGNRRDAFYSNLAPGEYRFHVSAANDDGAWSPQDTDIAITIAPWFYQTLWFYALCITAVIGLIAVFFLWRMRLAADRVHLQLMERMNERERIAREIHDTLLQGVQGLLLRLQALVARPVRDPLDSKVLDAAIEQARQMVIEGRGKIIALRGDTLEDNEPVQSILAVGEDLASLHPQVAFRLTAHGEPRALLPSARDEIIDIVREAIRNAFVHAQARHVDVHVDHEPRRLRIRVSDDGSGIDDDTVRAAAAAGHWGIVGMRERATRLGARLTLRQRQPQGTEWLLSVPCRAAYRPPQRKPMRKGDTVAP